MKRLENLKPHPRKLMMGSPVLPISQTFQYSDTLYLSSEYGPSFCGYVKSQKALKTRN